MRSETQIRQGLAELADTVRSREGYEANVRKRAQRIRTRRRVVSAAAAAACLAVVVSAFRILAPAAGPQLVATPPDGPFLGWASAGDALDAGLLAEAVKAWDSTSGSSASPHSAVRPLVATQVPYFGPVVVAQGYDSDGAPRLSFFTADRSNGSALTLRADRPAPDPAQTQVVSLVSSRLTGPSGVASSDYWGTYAIVVAMPGLTKLQVDTTAIDQTLRQGGGLDNGRFVVEELSNSSTAPTTTITGYAGTRTVFKTAGEGGAVGDPLAVSAAVVHRDQQQLTVSLADGRTIREGQLAVARDGLVGRVTAVDQDKKQATIALITSTAFVSPVYTNISNVPGTAHGTGDKVVVENIPLGEKSIINEGNRVLAPDPAQRSDTAGAVTIGRATRDKPNDATTVELTPTVDVAKLTEVQIMTPPAAASR
ncbi:rod shape-determining protein MreC [Actinoplanes regularis]|uniref:Rod shape-determining protein MreC n=1 Tax=Actinoplanes regularis TaxID=52697 RepID=A0A238XKG2_9ACTN|nr:rod shape-determining protein MreC [Actinoplanes regularis]GIE90521.1 hypothetical protein Are01nite_70010 [Actinoplanes regularis]SNR59061.1 rod shape-determining protein MreC [Actinoplanes regularis]